MGSFLVVVRILSGLKTYLAATGLVGLAIHQFASGMFGHGAQALLTAMATAALRRAIARLES